MKAILCFIVITFSFSGSSAAIAQSLGKPVVAPQTALKNMAAFMNYYNAHLYLSEDFTAYDTKGHTISKGELLKATATGDYLPLQLAAKSNKLSYMLYKLGKDTDDDVRRMLKQTGLTFYGCYQMEGKPFPAFHYVDLNGNIYTSENTKGKIIVLKAWFISCKPCVAEMPELNKLTEQYKNRKDIVFISIAWDSKKALEAFEKRIGFKYAIVPVKASYIEKDLHGTGYPIHWVINKKGNVVKMTYDAAEMIQVLRKEAA
ncbi:TlpA disulfide reductase family protein [Mucilaginibacter sp. L3T2-6]|uniref:TlpA family protein disulfide reductase n=1 Tax=Mucilaginibacter sp. L3T2-6 TaxID=3062491 RepID=UPI0026749E6A|nr:TlpA disulfide reductase family protein [Mucilaginibacter sp. L3T2-6]MDO3640854.1 TlpA disulfide reductase family protein [Mucilaginibacter sp. L3T2-6]MDV6213670.1 TlpA disulfide reductase family protein [Mucilaginibacter sp. L3T2-6]